MDIEKIIKTVRDSFKTGTEKTTDSILNSKPFEKYKDSDDKIADILDDAGKAVTGVFDKVSGAAEPVIKKSKAKIYEGLYEKYQKAGAPYGDTHEGFMKWTEEKERGVREKVDEEFEKGRQTIVKTAKKTSEFVGDAVAKHQKPADTTVDSAFPQDENQPQDETHKEE